MILTARGPEQQSHGVNNVLPFINLALALGKAGKPASVLKTLWHEEYEEEPDARFINERVHANIQRDGTFSVVPQMPGGITSPAQLRRIADVAERYRVPLVKLTGGQRIDLLGVRKDDLPKVWRDLDMPSGYAYGKSYRTCKSCVGSDFCRFGLGDSISLALKIEREFQGFDSPHKMKLATAGCPRNCSEAMVKDLGAVAVEGGKWEIYIGGAAGSSVRKGDVLCTVGSHEEVLLYMGRFIQYYRENAKYLERTHGLVRGEARDREDSRGGDGGQRRHRGTSRPGDRGFEGGLQRSLEGGMGGSGDESILVASACAVMIRNMQGLKLGAVSAIPLGEGRNFEVLGEKIAVFRTRSAELFAVQASCPHRGGPLADGLLGGTTLICPLHAWRFDVSTGEVCSANADSGSIRCGVDDSGQIVMSIEKE